jgi:hypothetical protein
MANITLPANPVNGQKVTIGTKIYQYNSTTNRWISRKIQTLGTLTTDFTVAAPTITLANNNITVNAATNNFVNFSVDKDATISIDNQTTNATAVLYTANNTLKIDATANPLESGIIVVSAFDGRNTTTTNFTFTIDNDPPFISIPQSSYTLATDGTAITVTATATDPENQPLTYSATVSGDTAAIASVTNSANVYTITPSTNDNNGGTAIVSFTVTDGVNVKTANGSFTLTFPPDFTTFARQSTVLTPPTAYGFDKYGGSVAMTDIDTIIAAHSFSDRDSLANAGDVVINEWNGSNWTSNRTIVRSSDIASNDQFGYQVAADPSGTTKFAASAPYDDQTNEANIGAIYVFAKSGSSWSQEAKLVPSNYSTGHNNHFLGQALAMDGNYIVAGAQNDRSGSSGSVAGGTAWLWENTTGSTWTQNWRITGAGSDTARSGLGLPGTVDIDATAGLVVLGSPESNSDSGTVKVYNLSGTLLATLSTTDTSAAKLFGNYVAVSGDKIAVYGTASTNGASQGKVVIFENTSGNTWTERQTIEDGTSGSGHYGFGKGLRMIGDNLIILETDADPSNGNSDPGSVHMYQWNSSTNQFDAKDEESYQQSTEHKGINVNALAMAIDGTDAIVITGKNNSTSYTATANYGQVIIYDNY